jgi:Leucine-rich repeat (LRR) protein
MGNTFNGSITADLTTLTNLLTLNLNGHNRGGAFNYYDQDGEDPTGSCPEVANTCQNYYIYRNSFNTVPQSVKDLPDLRQINLYSNTINDDSMQFASSVINYINIGGNPGINIPNCANKNSLQNFYAHYNSAGNVPADRNLFTTTSGAYKFANCGNLRLIYCYGSAYTGPIPKFAGNPNLYYFQGQYTALRGGRSDTEQDYVLYDDVFDDCADSMRYFQVASSSLLNAPMHPDCFEKPTGMIGIVFRSFNAGVNGAFPSLSTMQNLRYIVMLQNNFTGPLPNFFNNPRLYYCHLYGNSFSGAIPVIQSNALQYFYVHSNQLTSFGGLETPNLRRLFISYNQITGAIPDMNNLTLCYDFYMNNNNFTDYTAGALIACRSLYRIDISNNPNLPAGAVNNIVADLVANYEANPRSGISVNLANTSTPTGDAVEQIEFLRSKGWNMRL